MKPFVPKSVAIAGMVTLSGAARATAPGATECTGERPAQVQEVRPKPGTEVDAGAPLGATLVLLIGPSPVSPTSLRLALDGRDLEGQARIGMSEDSPASEASITYRGARPFSPGEHAAELSFADARGRGFCFRWSFRVRGS